jgi:hypothetical protein
MEESKKVDSRGACSSPIGPTRQDAVEGLECGVDVYQLGVTDFPCASTKKTVLLLLASTGFWSVGTDSENR